MMNLSFLVSFLLQPQFQSSIKLLVFGAVVQAGGKFYTWLVHRIKFKYYITAQFDQGNPAYEWIVLFLTEEKIWNRSRSFRVVARSSRREWGVKARPDTDNGGSAEYVPIYDEEQLFRWRGYWVEISRTTHPHQRHGGGGSNIHMVIYTTDMSVLSSLVEEAKLRYLKVSSPHVMVHTMGDNNSPYGHGAAWTQVKRKARRPLESIILQEGLLDSLVHDAQEFLSKEEWYLQAGIPHRRGYLLHGPPGTGKTSTIYALAGELGLEIYSLSLGSGTIDDAILQTAASSIPSKAIFLIEDIDCAFRAREDGDPAYPVPNSAFPYPPPPQIFTKKSPVTLSGLLNVIDGIGSEEGKLFFATTNYIDHLDAALLRPGRIDRKIEYKLATRKQAEALFLRFFPQYSNKALVASGDEKVFDDRNLPAIFSEAIPEHEFTTAELQGYLLLYKEDAEEAANGIPEWVKQERSERLEKKKREEAAKNLRAERFKGSGINGANTPASNLF
ncbi:P-loop containing nucleoside triphosphate hydrolase protein [Crucibulum laeve]|uniref:P-loop containing nucleoside triphosphate hydrolase protein n=1 Tax=Crucibulum laeve TaxID=68775 RepID=A0A5C3LPN7_9AGAR|nr:P-loop containing nucleoside triphosphate hydrolase protein [Crucibulum laeve]